MNDHERKLLIKIQKHIVALKSDQKDLIVRNFKFGIKTPYILTEGRSESHDA